MKWKIIYVLSVILNIEGFQALEKNARNQYSNMLWAGYYSAVHFNPKWSIVSDVQIRTNNWQENLAQGLIRSGLSYKLNKRFNVTNGFAYFNYFINNSIGRNEYRPWQEVGINDKLWKIKIFHRYRLEERINQKVNNDLPINDYVFNFRLRYKLDLRFPLKNETAEGTNVYLLAGNELMINCGKEVGFNFFDQNRTSAGIHFELNDKLGIQFQYLRIWQQLANGLSINNSNVLRFNLYHTINL